MGMKGSMNKISMEMTNKKKKKKKSKKKKKKVLKLDLFLTFK